MSFESGARGDNKNQEKQSVSQERCRCMSFFDLTLRILQAPLSFDTGFADEEQVVLRSRTTHSVDDNSRLDNKDVEAQDGFAGRSDSKSPED
jgi:hypothetical protein